MTYLAQGGALDTIDTKIEDDAATVVFTAKQRTVITAICVTENAGSTPTLTVDRYDGSTAYFLRNAEAVTAKETVTFDAVLPMVLKAGWSLRVTSSDVSGKFDVMVSYLLADATARGNG